jgi:hypothetical protein
VEREKGPVLTDTNFLLADTVQLKEMNKVKIINFRLFIDCYSFFDEEQACTG